MPAAYLLVAIGLVLILDFATSGATNPGTTTTTTTFCGTGVQGCATYTTTQFQVAIGTVSSSGQQLQGQITVDGTSCGTGSCTLYLMAFHTHTVAFGGVSGYTTPSLISFFLSEPTSFNGVYFLAGTSTTTLTVTLLNYGMPVPNREITASSGGITLTQYTNAQGQAIFTVNQNTVYQVGNMGLSTSVSVSVGTGPASYTFNMNLNAPFSLISFPGGQTNEGVTGVVCIGLGAFLFAGRKKK